jgi:hypothetical protein
LGLPEAKSLIGFWFNNGLAQPAIRRSNWARQPIQSAKFWSETLKWHLASQVERIRHWKIIQGSYEDCPDIEAHWHIDPPYSGISGRAYRYNCIDHKELAKWCKSRRGFVTVCENDGADWLKFEPVGIIYSHRAKGYSVEAVYEQNTVNL